MKSITYTETGPSSVLHLVEREWGAELATGIAELMEHDRRGPVRVAAVR